MPDKAQGLRLGVGKILQEFQFRQEELSPSPLGNHPGLDHLVDDGRYGLPGRADHGGKLFHGQIDRQTDAAFLRTAMISRLMEQKIHQSLSDVLKNQTGYNGKGLLEEFAENTHHGPGKNRVREHEAVEFGGGHRQKHGIFEGGDKGPGVGTVDIPFFQDGQGKLLVLKGEIDPHPPLFDDKHQIGTVIGLKDQDVAEEGHFGKLLPDRPIFRFLQLLDQVYREKIRFHDWFYRDKRINEPTAATRMAAGCA